MTTNGGLPIRGDNRMKKTPEQEFYTAMDDLNLAIEKLVRMKKNIPESMDEVNDAVYIINTVEEILPELDDFLVKWEGVK